MSLARGPIESEEYRALYGRRLSVEEFLIDFLGGLVPGVLFLAAAGFALLPPLHGLLTSLRGKEPLPTAAAVLSFLTALQRTPSAMWITLVLGAILLAYVIGHLFYRHDPKQADRRSFNRVSKAMDCRTPAARRANLGCENYKECEFPYPWFDAYLQQRGLTHLLPLARWCLHRGSWRSKNYINILKIRLRFHFPEKMGTIIRNEAHVRLAASTWYVARMLLFVSGLGCFVAVTVIFHAVLNSSWSLITGWQQTLSLFLPCALAPAIVLALSAYSYWTIRGFLHYQRLREIIFVLETAFTAFRDQPDILAPPFSGLGSDLLTPASESVAQRADESDGHLRHPQFFSDPSVGEDG